MTRPVPLSCPACGVKLIPPHGRGRFDNDGEFVEHRDACRCRHCEWVWFDTEPPVTCECGALVAVAIDDANAYSVLVEASE